MINTYATIREALQRQSRAPVVAEYKHGAGDAVVFRVQGARPLGNSLSLKGQLVDVSVSYVSPASPDRAIQSANMLLGSLVSTRSIRTEYGVLVAILDYEIPILADTDGSKPAVYAADFTFRCTIRAVV